MGVQIQPEGDKILVDTATIYLQTSNIEIPYIYSKPDSFLLGTFFDPEYGTLHADILTQVQPPVDFKFPEGAVADSAVLQLRFRSWFGAKYDPMQVKVYQMNKGKFEYSKSYKSNLEVSDYCDKSILLGERIFSARDVSVADSFRIYIPLSQDFVQKFSKVLNTVYTVENETEFQDFFNGMYITTEFGSASMLYIAGINLQYFFHYTYKYPQSDSIVTVKVAADYPYSNEVRLVNRFERPDQHTILQQINAQQGMNFISSPANFATQISLSLSELRNKTNTNGKKLLFNRTMLTVEIAEPNEGTLPNPLSQSLLLIKSSSDDRFFRTRELPSDTCAILSNYTYRIANDSVYYYYNFDIARLLTTELSKTDNAVENLSFNLVPVALGYDASGNIIEVKSQNTMTATKIKSGQNGKNSMKINVVYSGF
jgi:hypothetical protein